MGYVPERLLIRGLAFRRVALVRAGAETTFAMSALALAAAGLGGMALVLANVLRGLARVALLGAIVPLRDWLGPHRLSLAIYRKMLRFSVPLWLGALAEFASGNWDNLIISRLYGPAVMGQYQLAYNLADAPAGQVGEQVAEVLLPTFSRLGPDDRRRALVSSFGVLAFVMFPIAIGFASVAPTLVRVAMRPSWQSVAPMLAALCVLSILRPLSWQVGSYLLANERPAVQMSVSLLKLVVLLVALLTIGRLGTLWACAAVGVAFFVSLFAALRAIAVADGIPAHRLLGRCVSPLLACAPLVAAVLVARRAGVPGVLGLLLEVVAGVIGYVVGALVLAPRHTSELVALVHVARRRRATR
jgi:PST family polysaccharide transporter